jgi:serine/threonine protein kinase
MIAHEKPESLIGQQLGSYQILSLLGAGGMGVVYRARDTRLNRSVAIKVLPSDKVSDPERKRRFIQEARAASALNHPNIITVHDIGSEGGTDFIVMEYVLGKTLEQRIPRKGMQLNEALKLAVQVADALAKAHSAGIIHRDLKPSNVMVADDGFVKVLDFGLAKLTEAKTGAEGTRTLQSQTETGTAALTLPGVVLGTVGYMSPEQVRAEETDHRSDIFSFGAILYEMLTGRRAFSGTSAAEIMNAILKEEPAALGGSNGQITPGLVRIVSHCLEKRPDRRFQSATDLRFALESLSQLSEEGLFSSSTAPPATRSWKRARWAWITSAVLLVIASLLAVGHFRLPPTERKTTFLSLPLPEKTTVKLFNVQAGSAISPDGRRLALVAESEGQAHLWLYSFDSPAPRLLLGTDGASFPFWSPDSQAIGFFAQAKLKKIEVSGGLPSTLCNVKGFAVGGTWNRDGVILFGSHSASLHRISQLGGVAAPVTMLDQSHQEIAHRFPYFLPDGRHFVYLADSAEPEHRGICIGTLDGTTTKRLLRADSSAVYARPGYLLFLREQRLLAQPFDQQQLATTGDPFPVAQKVANNPIAKYAEMSVSDNSTLVYRSGSSTDSELVWFDRTGKAQAVVGPRAGYMHIDLSADGTQVVMDRIDPHNGEVDAWLLDLRRHIPTRLTSGKVGNFSSLWSADGTRIVSASSRGDGCNLYQTRTTSNDQEERLLESGAEYMNPTDWSRDGRFIIYSQWGSGTHQGDLWVLPLDGERRPRKYLATPFDEYWGRLSPDGRWMAYVSNETGSDEIYVQPFPEPGRRVRVSNGGGSHPRWRGDGREVFYLAPDKRLMAVAVKGKNAFEASGPVALFETPDFDLRHVEFPYAAAADGQRFLVIRPVENASARSLTVVLNWTAELKR